jgi:hypothetical protein
MKSTLIDKQTGRIVLKELITAAVVFVATMVLKKMAGRLVDKILGVNKRR